MYTHLHNRWTAQSSPLESAAARFIDDLSMDVFITSFNRPYCLDRCLSTLRKHVRKVRSIRVLDDGTPDRYLQEIQRRHPQVEILRSAQHAEKSDFIEHYTAGGSGLPEAISLPPWDLWRSNVQSASGRFLLLEDHLWCVRDMDLGGIGQIMKSRDCAQVRLFKSPTSARDLETPLTPEVSLIHPWYLKSRLHTLIYKTGLAHQRQWGRLLQRFGIEGNPWVLEAEALNVVCGIFERSFWLEVTRDARGAINQQQQLAHALEWATRHRRVSFARTTTDPISTSTSIPKENGSAGFDRVLFHKLLNESWFSGQFDPCAGMPGDFPKETIRAVLSQAGESSCTPEKWASWHDQFSENPGKQEGAQP